MTNKEQALPHWDMSNVYSGLEGDDFRADLAKMEKLFGDLEDYIAERGVQKLERHPDDIQAAADTLDRLITMFNEALLLDRTLGGFVNSFYSTDSYNSVAARLVSEFEQIGLRLDRSMVRFRAWVGSLGSVLDAICSRSPLASEHRPVLEEIIEQSRYLMDARQEDLASELLLSGGGSMWKLQGTVTSQLRVPFKREGEMQELPMTVIRNLAYDPDEDIRRRAFEAELKGWESIRESVAFSLNGVKGAAITMAKWRGREDVLHGALDGDRIDRKTLDAMLAAMHDSFPDFRRYLRSKAKKLGKEKLPWWDLFAPVGQTNTTYTWEETNAYIVDRFGTFSDDLPDLAREAFDGNWIDAEPRDGKRGGGFCMGIPGVEESRILVNFDGSFGSLTTVAHELGHAFHNHCQRGLPMMRRSSPMTLAETASIFCETLVFTSALASASPETKITILENQLMEATQVIVDIYSRYIFETETLKRREKAELSPDEFCEIMLDAQKQTYGDGLDEAHLHPYMWLLKPHYYMSERHFYNFPYAFGLLFGLGVFAIYRREGTDFVQRYNEFLRSTGEGKVADLASGFGIDVRSQDFWQESLGVIREYVDQYCEL